MGKHRSTNLSWSRSDRGLKRLNAWSRFPGSCSRASQQADGSGSFSSRYHGSLTADMPKRAPISEQMDHLECQQFRTCPIWSKLMAWPLGDEDSGQLLSFDAADFLPLTLSGRLFPGLPPSNSGDQSIPTGKSRSSTTSPSSVPGIAANVPSDQSPAENGTQECCCISVSESFSTVRR